MSPSAFRVTAAVILSGVLHGGCSAPAPPHLPIVPTSQPIALQLREADPALRSQTFRAVLDFESRYDLSAVRAEPPAVVDSAQVHTGRKSLLLAPKAKLDLSLSLAMSGQKFPGPWTLVGAYFYTSEGATITTAGIGDRRRPAVVPPRQWTAVMVDVSHVAPFAVDDRPSAVVTFAIEAPAGSKVWCDDVLVSDNTRTLVEAGDWLVRLHGFEVIASRKPFFEIRLKDRIATANGWTLDEASEMRVRLSSPGKPAVMTIYADGRRYVDGTYEPLVKGDLLPPGLASQHASPGQVEVPEEFGRVERTTEGDANNDGYNELRGAYQLRANGPRLQVTLTPAGARLISPILEITNLPPGQGLATMEGRLVQRIVRLGDGRVLIELPGELDRATTVTVSVKTATTRGS